MVIQYTDTEQPEVKSFKNYFDMSYNRHDQSGWEKLKRLDVYRVWSDGRVEHEPELTVMGEW